MTSHPSLPGLEDFINGCRMMAHLTGVPSDLLVAHGILLASALMAGKVCYRTTSHQAPQLIDTPLTVLTNEKESPPWFRASAEYYIDLQHSVDRRVQHVVDRCPSPAMVKNARRMIKLYGPVKDLLPDPLVELAESTCPRMVPANFRFVHDLKVGRLPSTASHQVFGSHLLLIATGDDCYRHLLPINGEKHEIPATLESRRSGSGQIIHGWGSLLRLRKVFRSVGPQDLMPLGLLLEFPASVIPHQAQSPTIEPYSRFFDTVFSARIGSPITFKPSPEIVSILNFEVEEQRKRATTSLVPSALSNPITQLPWNIATVLWRIERNHSTPAPELILEIARIACDLASTIHSNHLATVYRIFPCDSNGSTDPLAEAIIDKLAVKSLRLRSLTRSFHRVEAVDLAKRLTFLEERGLVRQSDDGRWHLSSCHGGQFSDSSPEMSASASSRPSKNKS